MDYAAFSALMVRLFGTDTHELKAFVTTRMPELLPAVQWDNAMNEVLVEMFEASQNRGLLDADFFEALAEHRPRHSEDILDLAKRFAPGDPPPIAIESAPDEHPLARFRACLTIRVDPQILLRLASILGLNTDEKDDAQAVVLNHVGSDASKAAVVINVLRGILGQHKPEVVSELRRSLEILPDDSDDAPTDNSEDGEHELLNRLRRYRFDRSPQWGQILVRVGAQDVRMHETFLLHGPQLQQPALFLRRIRQRAKEELEHELLEVELEPDGMALHQAEDVVNAIAMALPGDVQSGAHTLRKAAASLPVLLVPVLRGTTVPALSQQQRDALREFLDDHLEPLLEEAAPANLIRMLVIAEGRSEDPTIEVIRDSLNRSSLMFTDLGELGYPPWTEARNAIRALPKYGNVQTEFLDFLKPAYEELCEKNASLDRIVDNLFRGADAMLVDA